MLFLLFHHDRRFLISLAQAPIMPGVSVFKRIEGPYKQLTNVLGRGSVQARETALSTLSSLIEEVDDGLVFEKVLSQLVMQLGESDTWLKAAAPTTVRSASLRAVLESHHYLIHTVAP
jgi:hypothetical protein